MKLYAIKYLLTGKILSMKSSGGAYYRRRADAETRISNLNSNNYKIVSFSLEEVPNSIIKDKNYVYCYKANNKSKYLFYRSKSWGINDYKTYKLIPDFE